VNRSVTSLPCARKRKRRPRRNRKRRDLGRATWPCGTRGRRRRSSRTRSLGRPCSRGCNEAARRVLLPAGLVHDGFERRAAGAFHHRDDFGFLVGPLGSFALRGFALLRAFGLLGGLALRGLLRLDRRGVFGFACDVGLRCFFFGSQSWAVSHSSLQVGETASQICELRRFSRAQDEDQESPFLGHAKIKRAGGRL
jgi:hypothetical protein